MDRQILQVNRQVLRVDKQILWADIQILRVNRQILRVDRQILRVNRQILQVDRQILRVNRQILRADRYYEQTDRCYKWTDTTSRQTISMFLGNLGCSINYFKNVQMLNFINETPQLPSQKVPKNLFNAASIFKWWNFPKSSKCQNMVLIFIRLCRFFLWDTAIISILASIF